MRRPNVILVVSDDHGYADRGRLGVHPNVRTPALDRLADEGVSCTQAYVSAPICSPSRSGIITGRHQARWGVHWFDDAAFAPDDVPTMAEDFRRLGYATGYFGKVHYGKEEPGDRACPNHHGFDESFYGLAGRSMGRLNYLRRSRAAVADYGPEAAWRMAVQPLLEGDDEVDGEGFLTAELGQRARDFVRRNSEAGQPYFLMLAFNAVHNFCWQLPDEELESRGLPKHQDWDPDVSGYLDWYDGAISPNLPNGRAYYLAQLELMDAEIGALLGLLDELGGADDTLVVYTTDNGGSTCNYGDNTPLRGTKYSLFEGGIRVPLIARWPSGGIDGGRDFTPPVSTLDLAPTLLSAAGAHPAGHDGRNLLGGTGSRALHWDCGFQWAVRDGNLKLLYVDASSPTVAAVNQVEHTDLGSGMYLFDLVADPSETENLASRYPAEVARLHELHLAWKTSMRRSAQPATAAPNH